MFTRITSTPRPALTRTLSSQVYKENLRPKKFPASHATIIPLSQLETKRDITLSGHHHDEHETNSTTDLSTPGEQIWESSIGLRTIRHWNKWDWGIQSSTDKEKEDKEGHKDNSPRTALLVVRDPELSDVQRVEDVSRGEVMRQAADNVIEYMNQSYPGVMVLCEPGSHHLQDRLPTYVPTETQELERVIDFVVVIGGDGTLLHVSSMFPTTAPPMVGFNRGNLGFLMPFDLESDIPMAIDNVMNGGFYFFPRARLTCSIMDSDENVHSN
eukprot:TRINITY_DN7962_c1_g1_i1.p1 TRINITY_DN7962_c1_g1~~TRINITY_DN7962_c1_g1_i1.p1  ORF type:complete len:281 (+),score=19.02 TRINITY_DN7962_c1_g1_i1:36-845(+)